MADQLLMFSITTDEKHVILSAANDGIIIYNVENPLSPYKQSNLTLPNKNQAFSNTLNADNTLCFVGAQDYMYILNISDLTAPKLIYQFKLQKIQNYEVFLFADEKFLAVSSNFYGLNILDVRNFTYFGKSNNNNYYNDTFNSSAQQPQVFLATYQPGTYNINMKTRFSADEQFVFVLEVYTGLLCYKISNIYTQPLPTKIELVSNYQILGASMGIEQSLDKKYLFIGHRSWGVHIFDIRNPYYIREIQFLQSYG